jgi:hemoglobin
MVENLSVPRESIYQFAGGEVAFGALAEAHHQRCLRDPVLSHAFNHPLHPEHVRQLASYWGEVLGGPPLYSQLYGDHSRMLQIHAGEGADAEFDQRFVECFVAAADDAHLPEDLEFRQALHCYMEWATSELGLYAAPGSQVPEGLPMPHWGWNGLEERSTTD